MRNTRVRLLGVAAVLWGMATPVCASEGAPSYMDGAFRKFGRGIVNIVTCPAELIRMPELVGRRDGYLAGMTVGLSQGVWHTLLRGAAGVFEIATFYAEIPKGFAPLVTPEFVYQHGDWAE